MSSSSLCVALSGSTGFVGRHVQAELLGRGHTIRALVRDRGKATPDGRVTLIEGTLFDDAAVHEVVRGADAVVHLVGIIMEKWSTGQTFRRIHVDGTRNLLEAAKATGRVRKWVHMSALGARPNAVSTYHQTKWEAEELVRHSTSGGGGGLDYTIFRPSIIHGPDGEFMQMVKGFWTGAMPPFVPYFGAGMAGGKGAGKVQPVHVDDVAHCFAEALTNAKAKNETYPLGGPDVLTWPDMYAAVARHLPGARKKSIKAVPVWFAKAIAGLPGVPFNRDQVIMSQEDSTCGIAKVENDLGIKLRGFEAAVKEYAGEI